MRFFCIELGEYANAGPNAYASSLFDDDELDWGGCGCFTEGGDQ